MSVNLLRIIRNGILSNRNVEPDACWKCENFTDSGSTTEHSDSEGNIPGFAASMLEIFIESESDEKYHDSISLVSN